MRIISSSAIALLWVVDREMVSFRWTALSEMFHANDLWKGSGLTSKAMRTIFRKMEADVWCSSRTFRSHRGHEGL